MSKNLFADYGMDYEKGLRNCIGNIDFFKTILVMFLHDNCFLRAKKAYNSMDYKDLFNCLHELKGVCGNAALTELYEAIVPLVELLRSNSYKDEEISCLFSKIEESYNHTCEGITLITS